MNLRLWQMMKTAKNVSLPHVFKIIFKPTKDNHKAHMSQFGLLLSDYSQDVASCWRVLFLEKAYYSTALD
jgi:hypothetical protein